VVVVVNVFNDNVSTKDKISVDETANLKQHKKFTTELIKIKNEKINQLQKNDSNHIHINIHGLNQTKQNALIFLLPVILLILFPISGLDISSIFTSEENEIPTSSQGMKTGYFIENLKGDVMQTWKAWNLVDGEELIININNADQFPSSKIDLIKETILSEEIYEFDNSLTHKGPKGTSSIYYASWKEAIKTIEPHQNNPNLVLPYNFRIIESQKSEGDIIINLSNLMNADGYTGFTKSRVEGNEILKSTIKIFNVKNLSDEELKTIIRHELGHALGLSHSTDPDDLMYPTINMDYPMISSCDVDALHSLYDGNFESKYVCNS